MGNGKDKRAAVASTGRRTRSKRKGERASVSLEIEVQGRGGTYSGQTINLSGSGCLIWVSDERFADPDLARNLVHYGERVADEFQDMRLRFASSGVVREAEVVRVVRNKSKKNAPPLVACRFLHTLRENDCQRLGLDPSLVASVVDAEEGQPPGQQPAAESAKRKNGKPPEDPQAERRRAPRVDRIYYAQVMGDGGTFKAHILNLSHSGALMTLTDPAISPPTEPDKLVLFTKRMGLQFSNGMVLRILEGDVSVQADVVRVSERTHSGEMIIVIGVKFRRNLTPDECERLEVRPPPVRVDTASNVQEGGSDPLKGRTRIRELMGKAMQAGATDLHLKVGTPPRMRMAGTLLNVGKRMVTADESHEMALELMTRAQAAKFEREGDVELAYTIPKVGRFRINVLRQRGMTGMAIRCIPDRVPTLEELELHPLSRTLAERPRGLVLVTGPTGSGKSTTLAALVDHVNKTRACHIITMEDPIEYIHSDAEAHITQREIGRDAVDYATALKRALRQDPDVIMVGEMRDLETIGLALTAAETGHLVFATLHTTSAILTPDRIVDVFPHSQQTQIRMQLADSLQGIMAQMLLPRADQEGALVLAQEILVATDAVRALIRERKTPQIANMMQTGAKEGMQTLEAGLNDLVRRGVISYDTAVAKAHFPKQIRKGGQA